MYDLTITRLRLNENCFRVDNKILTINPNNKDAMVIVENMKPYYKIHVLITLWKRWDPDITYSMMAILDAAKEKQAKVYIHVPKMCKDLIKVIDQDLNLYDNYRIVIDNGDGTRITINGESFNGFTVKGPQMLSFEVNRHAVVIKLYIHTLLFDCEGEWTHILSKSFIPKNEYEHEGVFSSVYRKEDPELFKEDIINDFKKATPRGILKSFENDEDIWDYVMMQNSWVSLVKMKTEDGTEFTGTFEEQMNELAKDIMEGTINETKTE